jgi:hypothetical protein
MNFVGQVKKVQPSLTVVTELEYHWRKNLFFLLTGQQYRYKKHVTVGRIRQERCTQKR